MKKSHTINTSSSELATTVKAAMATHLQNLTTVKFLCSYGGIIIPRYSDGKLTYHGGQTRVLSVSRSITFTELARKLGDLCGMTVNLRCQLPTDDLDALITVTSDDDLANLMEEYDLATTAPSSLKIRAFLSPPLSTASFTSKSSSGSRSPPSPCPICLERSIRNNGCYVHRNRSQNQLYHEFS